MRIIAYLSLADFETSTFLSQDNVQYAHSFESSSQSFFSVCSNSDRKSKQYSWYCQTFSDVFYPEGRKRHWTLPLPREKYFHISIPWQQFYALYLYTIPYGYVNNLSRLSLCYRSLSGIHHKISKENHNLLHTLLYIKRVILHFPRSTVFSFLSFPDYERKSKKIISISQISKPTLYEMPDWMYQMTKRISASTSK